MAHALEDGNYFVVAFWGQRLYYVAAAVTSEGNFNVVSQRLKCYHASSFYRLGWVGVLRAAVEVSAIRRTADMDGVVVSLLTFVRVYSGDIWKAYVSRSECLSPVATSWPLGIRSPLPPVATA